MTLPYIQAINSFTDKEVLVIGDLMVDLYSYGIVDRISPEAPIPIIHLVSEEYVPGGAGNVCNNLLALEAKVHLLSVCGHDEYGEKVHGILKGLPSFNSNILIDNERRTTVKQRLVAGGQQLLRVDTEDTNYLSETLESQVIAFLREHIKNFDCVCVSDYAKGFITEKIAHTISTLANDNNVPLIVDTKPKHFKFFKHCTVITPNEKEVFSAYSNLSYEEAAEKLSHDTQSPVLITRGAAGMSYIKNEHGEIFNLPSYATDVRDVSGAGDTVVAVIAASFSVGLDIKDAAYLASKAAAIAVSKSQTSAVTQEELIGSI